MPSWASRPVPPNTTNARPAYSSPLNDIVDARAASATHPSPPYVPTLHHQPLSATTRTPSRPKTHNRSASHPFLSLFGKKKSSREFNEGGSNWNDSTDDDRSPDGDDLLAATGPRRRTSGKGKAVMGMDGEELQTGHCMTCDLKIRWPKRLKVFRCTACLTINDLEVWDRSKAQLPSGERLDTPRAPARQGKQVAPLSIERTSKIIDNCINTYLQDRKTRPAPSPGQRRRADTVDSLKPPESPTEGPPQHQHSIRRKPVPNRRGLPHADSAPLMGSVSVAEIHTPSRNPHSVPHIPTLHATSEQRQGPGNVLPRMPTKAPPPPPLNNTQASQPSRGPQPPTSRAGVQLHDSPYPQGRRGSADSGTEPSPKAAKTIFRQLEDYIIGNFGDFECLNISFSTARPGQANRAYSESSLRPSPAEIRKDFDFTPSSPGPGDISALDAKTLLIGDIAENGSWWSGRVERNHSYRTPHKREPSAEAVGPRLVNLKTPRIDWAAMARWYDMVLSAGQGWKEKHKSVCPDVQLSSVDLDDIEDDLREARLHTQRFLLKVTENLLKRPGRPLKEPDDMRFLLILLANPLLYPSTARSRFREDQDKGTSPPAISHGRQLSLQIPGGSSKVPSPRGPVRNASKRFGEHSGIIKRILGLISNLPNDCHRHLISWFSRFSEEQFQRLMDLVASFVTYRLARQREPKKNSAGTPTGGLIPDLSAGNASTSAQLHAALGLSGGNTVKAPDSKPQSVLYAEDWQLCAAAKVMALIFAANNNYHNLKKTEPVNLRPSVAGAASSGLAARERARSHGQLHPTSDFYNTLLDYYDLVVDFEAWEARRVKFTFCQYPFFLSIGAKIKIMEHDARRQMENKAREAFFNSIMSNRPLDNYLTLRVRRECLVEDSLSIISGAVGAGQEDIKKGLKVQFVGEEGVDAGGLRKEWFLLLVRDIFEPNHGMFLYDDDSHFCYFNPNAFETSDQYFLVGALLGLAIYNSTILDVPLPPFSFKKLLAAAPNQSATPNASKISINYTLEDLAEYRPALAHGLRQLLEYPGDVQETFCRDFVADVERYGVITQVPLCSNGEGRPVTNENRQEFVDLYVRYLLDVSVSRQFEPFKRGFYTVCGGNALSLFRPEEIELLVRGSDEPLDVKSVRAVAVYDGWRYPHPNSKLAKPIERPGETVPVIQWFWEFFEEVSPQDQRKMLSFITGSDRIPAVGATNLIIKILYAGEDCERFPVARTCFNSLLLYNYGNKRKLRDKLWRAACESEGFGLK